MRAVCGPRREESGPEVRGRNGLFPQAKGEAPKLEPPTRDDDGANASAANASGANGSAGRAAAATFSFNASKARPAPPSHCAARTLKRPWAVMGAALSPLRWAPFTSGLPYEPRQEQERGPALRHQ